MNKKLLLVTLMVAMLLCVLALSVGAASTTGNIDYDEKVTLKDGTELPIYDSDKNPLIWYISGTETVTVDGEETTKNIYSSVVSTATSQAPDKNGYYVVYNGQNQTYTGPTGEKLQYHYSQSIYVKHTTDTSVNFKGDDTMVVANFRGVDIGDFQGGTIDKLQYFFAPVNMVRSGDFRVSSLILADYTQSTNMRIVIGQAFAGGAAGKITEVRFPTIEPIFNEEGVLVNAFEIGNYAFQSCKLLTSLDFPETLYRVGNNAFQNCNNLVTIGDVPNLTVINADAFENCYTLTGLDFKNTTLTTIGARAFRYAGVQANVEFPSTLTSIGENAFYQAKLVKAVTLSENIDTLGTQAFRQINTLEYFDFNNCKVESISDYFFWKDGALRAVVLPEGFKTFGSVPFEGCSKLEVIYFPDSLTYLTTFEKISNLYFVNEQFTVEWYEGIFDSADWDGQKPEKPQIYYMPSSLTSVHDRALHTCTGINDTIVFPEGITKIAGEYMFFAIEKNIVFLGEVTDLNVNSTKKSNYYFINDSVTEESLALTGNGSHNLYFHSKGAHFGKTSTSVEATCTENERVAWICFCGTSMGASEVENTALGHNHSIFVDIVYANYSADGYYSYKCERCDDVNNEKVADALFTCLGYSTKSYGNIGIAVGYMAKKEIISEYEGVTGKTVQYGVFAVSQSKLGENDVFGEDGTASDKAIVADLTSRERTAFEIKVTGFEDSQKDIKLAIGAYVSVSDENGTEYSYMQDSTKGEFSGKYYFASFNDIVG